LIKPSIVVDFIKVRTTYGKLLYYTLFKHDPESNFGIVSLNKLKKGLKMRLTLNVMAYENIDNEKNPKDFIWGAWLKADTIEEMRAKVQEWQYDERVGAGNWEPAPLFLDHKLVGYMSYNGIVWKNKLRKSKVIEVPDSKL
jgi:hypothetical protein